MAKSTPEDLWHVMRELIPDDHSDQVSAEYYIDSLLDEGGAQVVLDLGCGTGRSSKFFFRKSESIRWHGLDVEDSPEVRTRTRDDLTFHVFDGRSIPFDGSTFDMVYSNQVFEHVREPEALLAEVARVLKPGGAFIGSVSYLEPYHSLSLWNYTPYGWKVLLESAGLRPVEFRPGIDGVALLQRQFLGRKKEASKWFTSSPLNEEIEEWGRKSGRRPALINARKLQFCGHLVFHAERAAAT